MYSDFIHEYQSLGHMSKVDTYSKPYYFMRHHGVFRDHSTTTKLRVVFNTSQKSTSNVSLNELQSIGPEFLRESYFDYASASKFNLEQELPEIKNVTHVLVTTNENKQFRFPFHKFSQLDILVRGVARLKRACYNRSSNNKNNIRTGPLSTDELKISLNLLVRFPQMESFPDSYELLINKKILPHKHNLLNLSPFIDDYQIIRIGGRLGSSEFEYNKKHPILISSKHRLSVILFEQEHLKLLHAGSQLLLYTIRENWWPIGGRNLARKVINNCVRCARLRAKTPEPIMGNLPKDRLTPGYPFRICGVDYAGLIKLLTMHGRGAKTIKAYICLFVCFSTRAIHLELVSDLTTDAYLLALKRFISRRSKPSQIYSDNGKCFVGLMNEFAKFISNSSDKIVNYASSQGIKFSFIPPYAPHFGGLWEAGVKSCKYHLRRVIGNAHLTFEEFTTMLAQIEALLNSRPLTPFSSDPTDMSPLTPAHFLIGRPLTAPTCTNLKDRPMHRVTRYQRVEQMRQHFWRRWSLEFVSELQTRSKWKTNKSSIEIGSLVVIKDTNAPPLRWNLDRVTKVYPGNDGISRVADIRTASGIVRRAFSKICPLPVETKEHH
ncbi:hypothetical protein evm_011339 [Chilo suppressalis]|nr:hypothetical protein evm_011339 [Chilo suppressalis]